MSAFIRRIAAEARGYRKWRREQRQPIDDALPRFFKRLPAATADDWARAIERILSEADGNG